MTLVSVCASASIVDWLSCKAVALIVNQYYFPVKSFYSETSYIMLAYPKSARCQLDCEGITNPDMQARQRYVEQPTDDYKGERNNQSNGCFLLHIFFFKFDWSQALIRRFRRFFGVWEVYFLLRDILRYPNMSKLAGI